VPSLKPSKFATGRLPVPDGSYSGGNTAEGQAALFSLTTDMNRIAVLKLPMVELLSEEDPTAALL